MLHNPQSQDNLYNLHGSSLPGLFNSNSTINVPSPSDTVNEFESHKLSQIQAGKTNGLNANNYSRASFTSFPNTNRPRHQNSLLNSTTTPPYREPSFYPSSSDIYASNVVSPTSSTMPSFDPRLPSEFGTASVLGGGHKGFIDSYNNMMPSHQNVNKPALSQSQQHPHTAYSSNTPFVNGMHSQTPYGPHIPSAVTQSGPTSTGGNSGPTNFSSSKDNSQEEISTIFVVGFPDDMQEREFQNMFTFCPGFEAATLKIPNKEYTSYGGLNQNRGYQGYGGSNDPYNLMTINQGGVLVDGGREGTIGSWPGDDGNPSHFMPGAPMQPRKQIIGFAKFRTREEAFGARDVLQGRRIDIEKGAVLKAEMAKKNLHTKRGVGPLPNNPSVTGANHNQVGNPQLNHVNTAASLPSVNNMGITYGGYASHPGSLATENYNALPHESFARNERDNVAVGRSTQWRDVVQPDTSQHLTGVSINHLPSPSLLREREEDERRREGAINAIGYNPTRGPRERIAEEEKRKEMRLRANNAAAYDAFHSVTVSGPPGISRQASTTSGLNGNGNTLVPPEHEAGLISSLGSSPSLGHGFPGAIARSQSSSQIHSTFDEVVGPWDNINRALPPNASARSPTGSQRSSSPSAPAPSHLEGQDAFQSLTRLNGAGPSTPHQFADNPAGNSLRSPENQLDAVMAQKIDNLALNMDNGTTSPQLPSPASGASAGSSRNTVDQNPPINTLYVGNLPTSPPPIGTPQDYLEDAIRELFRTQPGFRRLLYRQKSNTPMCFVEFEDVPHAAKALENLQGNTLNGFLKSGIRLSYSKNPLGVRTPTSATSNGSSLQLQQNQHMHGVSNQDNANDLTSQPARPVLRKDDNMSIGNPNTIHNYLASPPPRFLPSQNSGHFGPSTSPANVGSPVNFLRPAGGSMNSFNVNFSTGNGLSGTSIPSMSFSPFTIKDQESLIPTQSAVSEEALHSQK